MKANGMKSIFLCHIVLAILANSLVMASDGDERRFQLDYRFQVGQLPAGKKVRVWWPLPNTTDHQAVVDLSHTAPVVPNIQQDDIHGNRMAHFEVLSPESGMVQVVSKFEVSRREVTPDNVKSKSVSPELITQYLKSSRLVPVHGAHEKLITNADPNMRDLYSGVLNHVDYRKDQPGWGRGDTKWVCDSRFGNCTDFHSLFLSLARSRKVPAKFVIGFSIPDERSGNVSGYHCWAWYLEGGQTWRPVDISEADKQPQQADYFFGNLTADRVTLSTGRDLVLQPPQDGEPLNFFIAPYVEVDGQKYSTDNIQLQHSYKDLP